MVVSAHGRRGRRPGSLAGDERPTSWSSRVPRAGALRPATRGSFLRLHTALENPVTDSSATSGSRVAPRPDRALLHRRPPGRRSVPAMTGRSGWPATISETSPNANRPRGTRRSGRHRQVPPHPARPRADRSAPPCAASRPPHPPPRRLIEAGETIAETAAAAGFADQSHLHRHFQRGLGLTPGEY